MISGVGKIVSLTRLQIFLILANMFLCTFPKQLHRSNLNFTNLMGIMQDDDPKNRLLRK